MDYDILLDLVTDLGYSLAMSGAETYRVEESINRILATYGMESEVFAITNCMDNGAMENFFGRLKVEMFYGEQFDSVDEFIQALDDYIYYYNNERISLKLKGMSPVQYRTHSQAN